MSTEKAPLKVGDRVFAVDGWEVKVVSATVARITPKFAWLDGPRNGGFSYTHRHNPDNLSRTPQEAALRFLADVQQQHQARLKALEDVAEHLAKAQALNDRVVLEALHAAVQP